MSFANPTRLRNEFPRKLFPGSELLRPVTVKQYSEFLRNYLEIGGQISRITESSLDYEGILYAPEDCSVPRDCGANAVYVLAAKGVVVDRVNIPASLGDHGKTYYFGEKTEDCITSGADVSLFPEVATYLLKKGFEFKPEHFRESLLSKDPVLTQERIDRLIEMLPHKCTRDFTRNFNSHSSSDNNPDVLMDTLEKYKQTKQLARYSAEASLKLDSLKKEIIELLKPKEFNIDGTRAAEKLIQGVPDVKDYYRVEKPKPSHAKSKPTFWKRFGLT